jgi:hypothetical protein
VSEQTSTRTRSEILNGKAFEVDEELMYKNFGRESFSLKHNLTDHPLLTIDRLAQLADSLPPDQAEFTDHKMPDVMPEGTVQDETMTAGDVVRGIETNGKWMVLKRVHTDPEYQEMTDWILGQIHSEKVEEEGGRVSSECYVIISSPESNVASHFDPEYNILWQIQGTKQMTVGHFKDIATEHAEAERYYGGGHRNINEVPQRATTYPMEPGVGVHIPAQAPHMIKNGPTFSISLSTSFYTRDSAALVDAYAMNARLRKLRISPNPPGSHPGRDRLKAGAWRGMRRGRDAARSIASRS